MADFDKLLGKIVVLTIVSYFSWRVFQSGQKLLARKIGLSVSEEFSPNRLFPSMSICMYLREIANNSLFQDIDGNLQKVLDDVLIHLVHKNGTKSE